MTYENSIGDNSAGAIDSEVVKRYRDRAAKIMLEQKELGDDLKEICAEADAAGVSTKRELRRLAREALMDPEVLRAQLDRMEALRAALGEFAETPLGLAAQAEPRRRGRPRKNNNGVEANF